MDAIDISQYMTVTEARDAIGASQRAIWRVLDRAGREEVTIKFLGRTLVRRDALPKLEAAFFPFGSENRERAVREWGRAGGAAKAANLEWDFVPPAPKPRAARKKASRKKLG